jgi:hypothetical protein
VSSGRSDPDRGNTLAISSLEQPDERSMHGPTLFTNVSVLEQKQEKSVGEHPTVLPADTRQSKAHLGSCDTRPGRSVS